jgi:DNA-directed RNA polymerase sigma subunit (sigma70/sigma32)
MEDTSYPMAPGSTVDLDHTILSSSVDIERSTIQEDTAKFLREVLHELDICERDKFIFLQYYDIANPDRKTGMKSLLSLSAIIDLTPERIRQIKEKTAHELKAEFMRRDVRTITDCF